MRKLISAVSNMHQAIFKYLMVIITVVLIVMILPRETQFNFSYRLGKPWMYENQIAPFDFSITKSEEEINKEKAERLATIHPVYRFNKLTSEQMANQFLSELGDSAERAISADGSRRLKLEKTGTDILTRLYTTGIILLDDRYPVTGDSVVTILKDNEAEDHRAGEYFTIRSASEFIADELQKLSVAERSPMQRLLENALSHNLVYDDKTTKQWIKQSLESISFSHGLVQAGETIILKGDVVNGEKFQKLESLKAELKSQENSGSTKWLMRLGHLILVSITMSILLIFLALFRREIFEDNSRLLLLLILIFLMTVMFTWARKYSQVPVYIIPMCILPVVVRAFYDTRIALFTHVLTLMIVGHEAPGGFEYVFMQVIAGMVAVFSIVTLSRRSQFFISVVMIFATYTACFIGISLIHEATFQTIDWINLKWFFGNAIITLFAFPLIFIFEKSFGILSDVSLMELSDSNARLLRELSLKAPGTFQHSLQVANLAEAAIQKVGGNPLLVRAGALYHDIGKTDMPQYFIENQTTQANPHDELSFEESARIIRSHVIRGVEKAKRHNIPEQIIDFIRTHHGDMRLQYFYQNFVKSFPDVIPDEEEFRYQGPLPFSKETAVLMMADSVEAASRSLKSTNRESIDALVDSIIQNQIEQNQFINSPVTLKDISNIRKIFKKMLMSIYHVRIEYPN